MSKRARPGDVFTSLQQRAGTALAKQHAGGSAETCWEELKAIDLELWPVVRQALQQCGGLNESGRIQSPGSGKLHPAIARLLLDAITFGLEGKLPPTWP